MNSKAFYIDLGGKNVRTNSNESTQCLYNLTVAMKGTELTEPKFKTQPKFL